MTPDVLAPQASGRGALRGLVPGLVLAGVFVVVLWQTVDMARVGALVMHAVWWPLFLALSAYALDFTLRALRFWRLLEAGEGTERRAGFKGSIAPYIASFGISDILPLRLGDVFRVHWFHKREGFPAGRVLGAMIVERMLDLVSILLVAAMTLMVAGIGLPGPAADALGLVMLLAAVACLGVLLLPAVVDRVARRVEHGSSSALLRRIATAGQSVATALRDIGTLRRLGGMLLLSILLWLLESLVMLGAWVSLGGPIAEWVKPLFAFALSTLGTLFPGLPGHFGSYDVAGVVSLSAAGVAAEQATATVLLAHLLLWLPTALFGLLWLMTSAGEPVPAHS